MTLARLLKNMWFYHQQNRKLGILYRDIIAELRVKYPEDNTFDLMDKSIQVLTLQIAKARLLYTLKNGSIPRSAKIKEKA